MKRYLIILLLFFYAGLQAQTDNKKYPEPEFINEVYYLKKDSNSNSLVRLEKSSSKMETKTKVMGGGESGYSIEGGKSSVRVVNGNSLSFVFSNGTSASTASAADNAKRDSIMRANGVDPSMMESFGSMRDPANSMTLYKTETAKNERKVIIQKTPAPFSKKMGSSDKYTFSARKIREGYWELVIDKTLPKGEYAFSMMNMMSMDGGTVLFAFGVD